MLTFFAGDKRMINCCLNDECHLSEQELLELRRKCVYRITLIMVNATPTNTRTPISMIVTGFCRLIIIFII
jgi:hypothetical protein